MADMNILTEDVITLREARKYLPRVSGKKQTHYCTLYRWALRGVGGTKLESVKIGSQIVTSKQALTRFIRRLSDRKA
jgi:hypothetical protein